MIKDQITDALKRATGAKDIKLDMPANPDHGDYASNLAVALGDRQGKPPIEFAKEIVSKLVEDGQLKKFVSRVDAAPPGFINFWVSDEALADGVLRLLGPNPVSLVEAAPTAARPKVVVEYSSPNIAKPFGIGHFRSTIIGDAVANLLEAVGFEVHRDNHLGDWGTQFGKQIYAIKTWGDEGALDKSENPVKELVALYIKFHEEAQKDKSLEDKGREWFKKLEEGDPEARRLWQKCVDWSIREFGKVYKVLGIKFTENDGLGYPESYFEHMMQPVIDELAAKGLLKEGKEGAKIVEYPNGLPPLMIVKKDGATLYATRDLATDKFRLEKYGRDVIIINEVGAEQSLYFKQLFELEKMLGWIKEGQRVHVKHGLFKLGTRKMSTRKGEVIWLMDVIREAIEKAKKFGGDDKLSQAVAVGALKWNELKRAPIKDVVFDWDEILSMEGNSGPYLQYTYARAYSIVRSSLLSGPASRSASRWASEDFRSLGNHHSNVPGNNAVSESFDEKEKSVARVLLHYPEIVKDAAINYSPHVLANYLFGLAQAFNSFYNSERVIGSEREEVRLRLTKAVAEVIKNGLELLGIEALEKM